MWLSMLYVIHERLVKLKVKDEKLRNIHSKIDLGLLHKFRNRTFYFQSNFRTKHHNNYIVKNRFGSARDLCERQDFVVRKMVRFLKYSQNFDTLIISSASNIKKSS